MFLKGICEQANKIINYTIKCDQINYGLPVAGALVIATAFFFYIRPFETCIRKWEINNKEIKLIRRRVGVNKSDLVWKVFDRNARKTYQKVVLEDYNSSHVTYLKKLPSSENVERFHASYERTHEKIKKIVDQITLLQEVVEIERREKSNSSLVHLVKKREERLRDIEKIEVNFLRTIPIQNRISYFFDHEIVSANPFPKLRKITFHSRYDNEVTIDRDHMAITVLARSGKKCCRMGHTVIAYEGILRGMPWVEYAHLRKIGGSSLGKVERIKRKILSDEKIISKSMTWRKQSWLVAKMIREIKRQKGIRKPFHLFGRNSIVNIISRIFEGKYKVSDPPNNCMTWAIQVLQYADIILQEDLVLADVPRLQVRDLRDVRDKESTCVIS